MRRTGTRAAIVATVLIAVPVVAAGQAPVTSFERLNTRLKPGDTVWLTDAQGREVKGKIQALAPDAITLKGDGPMSFAAREVSLIRERDSDTLRNGALIGLGVGGGLGIAGCVSMAVHEDGNLGWCALAVGFYGGIGTAIGVGVDAMIPGKKLVAYRAPVASGATGRARLSIAPVITPRAKGVAVSFAF
jgi:hypothetical protein